MRKNKNKRQPTKRKTASQTQKSKRPRNDSPKMTEKDSSELTPFEIFFQKVSDTHLSIENNVSAFDTRLSLIEILHKDIQRCDRRSRVSQSS